ncbi:fibronectin type III domain-containing protein [Candidatus Berkelbacteria bacterium]|nr:fibronectin type III domain-containing protein [Candidatus Berkelbacteria bacterium]
MMMRHQKNWKLWLARFLTLSVTLQAGLMNLFIDAPTVQAADRTPVVLNEISPAGDWIELFTTADVNFNDAEGWVLITSNGTSVKLSGTMTPGQFKSFTFATAPLGLDNGSVKLVHGSVDLDTVTWGTERLVLLPGVTGNNTLARSDDGSGRWISNVAATQDASNKPVMTGLPPVPTTVKVPATSSSPVDIINASSQGLVTVQAGYSGTATLAATLIDSAGQATPIAQAATDTMDGGSVSGISASALKDGSVAVRAYTDSSGKRSAWATQIATKDTIAPSIPVPLVAAGTQNGQNVINSHNVADVRISIGTPNTDASLLTVTLIDSLTTTVSKTLSVDGSRSLDARGLVDGSLALSVTVTDLAGNTSGVGATAIGKDTVGPSAPSDLRGHAANGYVDLSWDASPSADIGSYRIYSNGSTGDIDPNSPLGDVPAATRSFTTARQPNGQTIFQVRSVDRFGNEETTGVNVTVIVTGPLSEETLNGSNHRILDLIDPLRLWLKIADTTKGNADISVLNHSTTNPTPVSLPSGHAAAGKYFELGTSNTTIFPMEVRIYYTETDLSAIGAKNDGQLEGIRFYDATKKTWSLYAKTGVSTADVTVGSLRFAGYVWAMADHLTPIVASADIAAPSVPSHFVATAGDSRVSLTWNRVSDTAGYLLRYREATNTDRTAYQTLVVSGGDVTSAILKGFENGVLVEFGVSSLDWVGNQSDFSSIEQTPVTAGSRADFILPTQTASKALPSGSAALAQTGEPSPRNSASQNEITDKTDQPSSVNEQPPLNQDQSTTDQGSTNQSDQNQGGAANTRTLVTILIIVIAAAAGFGGYYGYQWWMTKPDITPSDSNEKPASPPPTKPEPEEKKTIRQDRGGRW